MSDAVNYTEIYSQHVELLPGRTLLQTTGGLGVNLLSGIGVFGTGSASAGDALGGAGGSANGGR